MTTAGSTVGTLSLSFFTLVVVGALIWYVRRVVWSAVVGGYGAHLLQWWAQAMCIVVVTSMQTCKGYISGRIGCICPSSTNVTVSIPLPPCACMCAHSPRTGDTVWDGLLSWCKSSGKQINSSLQYCRASEWGGECPRWVLLIRTYVASAMGLLV